ncbi:MAG: S8 family peptidase, partial [Hungatella sp.]
TPEERKKSEELQVGYHPEEKTWELIVKHSDSIEVLKEYGIQIYELLGNYSILTVPESLIDRISEFPQIEYIEKPKRLFFAVNQAKSASCIDYVQVEGNTGHPYLSGRGTIVAILDSGIDYYHEDFRNPDGSTRILELWDQSLDRVFDQAEINAALESGSRAAAGKLLPSLDGSGHGTAVAGIAAGNGREKNGAYRGVAYESELLVVKLGIPAPEGFPRTTELMKALDYTVRRAVFYQKPVAVNISFGNTYGSHDGSSLLETYIDAISNYGKSVIAVGTGNEGGKGGHTSGILSMGKTKEIELSLSPYETGISVQLWKNYTDEFEISLVTPSGQMVGPLIPQAGIQTLDYENTTILMYYGEPSPYSQAQEIYFDFIPKGDFLNSGIWKFRFVPQKIITGEFDFWLPSASVLNKSTYFLRSTQDTTLTIPATAEMVISVGAYDDAYQQYADFSGRGYTRVTNQIKPDLAAPGVRIMTVHTGGGYDMVTGTSFATPFVTGSAALLMEWGIS